MFQTVPILFTFPTSIANLPASNGAAPPPVAAVKADNPTVSIATAPIVPTVNPNCPAKFPQAFPALPVNGTNCFIAPNSPDALSRIPCCAEVSYKGFRLDCANTCLAVSSPKASSHSLL